MSYFRIHLNIILNLFFKDIRKQCYLKYFYDKKNYRDMINDTILGKFRLNNLGHCIEFQNMVDFEPMEDDFTYISKNIISTDVKISRASRSSCCSCIDNCTNDWNCCSARRSSRLAYDSNKCLQRIGNTHLPIYECNELCKCGPNCANRVVQLGSKIAVCIFKTSTGKSLGLKTLEPIQKGQFINEYVGEIIDYVTSESRDKLYVKTGTYYIFNMDFYHNVEPFSIDATKYGNATRFINHSCNPNCSVYSVWYDCIDRRFPKLALFAIRQVLLIKTRKNL